jgi:molecular chaperone IbpA
LLFKGEKMTKLTAFDITPFYRNAIGVDRLFDRIVNQLDHAASTNYPPYNIIETSENTFEVQVATAGFAQGEVEITVKYSELIITGDKLPTGLPNGHIVRHQGISARKFIRTFSLSDYVEVVSAVMRDGTLTVSLERHIPDSKKPKSIAITYEN